MKEKKVIAFRNVPTKLPLIGLFILYTSLHYWNVPNWVMIVFYVIGSILLILAIIRISKERQINIFSKKGLKKLSFKERIQESMPDKK